MVKMDDDSVPDEVETSSETPFMRRSRAVAIRRSRIPPGIRRVAWWAGLIVFIIVPVGFGAYTLADYLLTSPRFKLTSPRDVMVEGNHYVSHAEVLAALGVEGGTLRAREDIFRISLREGEKQVESIPWVQSATVMRSYPHSLTVYVTERAPVAFVNVDHQIRMVDSYGTLLEPPEKSHFDLPIVNGLDFQGSAAERTGRLRLFQEFMQETKDKISASRWTVSEVDLSDPGNLKALLVQDGQTLLVYFGHTDFLARFENLLAVLPQLRKTNARVDSVDLRYRNQVVVNPAEEGSGTAQTNTSRTAGKAKGN